MCGRFAQTTSSDELVRLFRIASGVASHSRYNLAPTQPVLVVRETDQGRILQQTRWGLVPRWASDLSRGASLINARSETVFEKRSFSNLARTQRCVVPASGFYEWRDTPAGKMPTLFTPRSAPVFRFAGLWSAWADDAGALVYTCTILTTNANQTMAPFHHRMPVLLTENGAEIWLDRAKTAPDALRPLFLSAPNDAVRLRAVSKRINNVRHDDPDCWNPPAVGGC